MFQVLWKRFTYQQRRSEYKEENYRTSDIAIVHNVLINPAKGVQDSQSLLLISAKIFPSIELTTNLHLYMPKVNAQLLHYTLLADRSRALCEATNAKVALHHIYSNQHVSLKNSISTYPSVPNAASHPVRSPDAPTPICPLTPGAANPAPYCAGYGCDCGAP
jgi:hypothetical protein